MACLIVEGGRGDATILMVLKHRVMCMEHLQENLKLITSAGNTTLI